MICFFFFLITWKVNRRKQTDYVRVKNMGIDNKHGMKCN